MLTNIILLLAVMITNYMTGTRTITLLGSFQLIFWQHFDEAIFITIIIVIVKMRKLSNLLITCKYKQNFNSTWL